MSQTRPNHNQHNNKIITPAMVTGVILAGGQGRRMGGQDKGLMEFQGRPLVAHLLEQLRPQTGSVLINANRNQNQYQTYGVPVISDQLTDFQGPLAGFATAMRHARTPWLLTLPCDGPYLAADMLERMAAALQQENAELAVAHDGQRLQPVHALLPVSLLESLMTFLDSGERKIDRWYAQHRMATADFSDQPGLFDNINTPEQKATLEQAATPAPEAATTEPPIIGICAYSGTGKTTLLTQLIPLLKEKGLRLTVIKHGHHTLELDRPGKDSYKFREAGADQVILAASTRLAIMQECHTQQEPRLANILQLVNRDCADLVLVEGFKHEHYPKIEVNRPALHKPLLFPDDENVLALVTDAPPDLPATARPIPQLDLNHPEQIAEFIWKRVVKRAQPAPETATKTTAGIASEAGIVKAQADHQTGTSEADTLLTTPSCADPSDPDSLPLKEAQERLLAAVSPLTATIKRPLRDTLGQILAQAITSPFNVPNHTNAAMDGYAVRGTDLPERGTSTLSLIGSAFAGQPFTGTCQPGQCVRIMTGAIMPAGTDTVVMQEQAAVTTAGQDTGKNPQVRIGSGHQAGQNVRQAGEDIRQGQVVLSQGRRINPADLGLLASLGVAEASVYRPPRVAFFSTGDELRSLGEPLPAGCIYDSNRYTLYSLLTELGMDILDMGVVPDQPELLEKALREAGENADVVITSGGVSVGEADYIKTVLEQAGEMNFWKLAIKPGRPLTFGRLSRGNALFFGLPGNPVAVMVTFQLLVQPILRKLAGETDYQPLIINARSRSKLRKKPGRTEFIRGIVSRDPHGEMVVEKAGHQGSGILTSMSRANCFILLPEANAGVAAGDIVSVQPFRY